MITKVIMPQLSLTMQSGIVLEWYKKKGDFVKKGELICSIEGDKATVDIEAPASGYIKKITAQIGGEFPVKQAMAYIGEKDDVVKEDTITDEIPTKRTTEKIKLSEAKPTNQASSHRIKASPVARRLAKEYGVDLSLIKGTGPDGLIKKEDVLREKELTQKRTTKLKVKREINITGIKKIVAERMKESYLNAPHFSLTLSVRMDAVNQLRDEFSQEYHVTYTDVIIVATAINLRKHELLNSCTKDGKILIFDEINIGIATSTEKGLIVPVIKNVDKKSLVEITETRESLINLTRQGDQAIDDLSGGTFTITNLGMFGIEQFNAIIYPNQAAILAIGCVSQIPSLNTNGEPVLTPIMKVTLVCDHRIVDGADGARFLVDLKSTLENLPNLKSKNRSKK